MKCECGNEIHPRTGMGMPGALYDHLCSPCADAEKHRRFLEQAGMSTSMIMKYDFVSILWPCYMEGEE